MKRGFHVVSELAFERQGLGTPRYHVITRRGRLFWCGCMPYIRIGNTWKCPITLKGSRRFIKKPGNRSGAVLLPHFEERRAG